MKEFSYALEFYNRCYFDLDDIDTFKNEVEIAEKTEEYYLRFSDNTEEIRNSVLISYKFRRNLSLEDRKAYVKGIIFSRQFMNENDVYELIDDFDRRKTDNSYDKSIFSIRTWSDEFDYDFFYNFLRNTYTNKIDAINKKSEKYLEFVKKIKLEQENKSDEEENETEELVKDNSVALEDEDDEEEEEENVTVEEFFPKKNYINDNLSLLDRLEISKEYFESYAEGTLKYKNITEDDKEYPLVVNGLFEYNRYITHIYERTYKFLANEYLRKTKNLSLLI
ncbi:MAG: hypothetical protein IKF36_03750 [Bacilli bacterium]|nr:hypothetical protein [Bacilli bacterium]